MQARRLKFIVSILLVVGAIGLLVATSTTKSGYTTDYYQTPSEFLRRAQEYTGRAVRVNGKIRPGSVRHIRGENGPPALEFVLADTTSTLPVRYEGTTVPDAFREGADLVVEGVYAANGVLSARQLLVKCPSKYEADPTAGHDEARRLEGRG